MDFTITFAKLFFISLYLMAPLLGILSFLIVILGQIVCRLEKWSRFDALYWSFITATTVGYGDIRALRKTSRAISVLIAFIGLMLTGIIIAVTVNTASIALKKNIDPGAIEKLKGKYEGVQLSATNVSADLSWLTNMEKKSNNQMTITSPNWPANRHPNYRLDLRGNWAEF
ncbi:MAG: potassium channel family protein [Pseudomonadales bacterium]|nr:potassium channel family protein [Pseudomonadales bacterium]